MHLARLISVLETIATAGRPLAASELQEITGMPLPTCYRLVQDLTQHGLLDDQHSNKRYVIGERLLRIAFLSSTDLQVSDITEPALKATASELGESVFLSRFQKQGVSIIDVQIPSDPSISYIHPGLGVRPAHACSCAKAIVAFADKEFREQILRGPMKNYTAQTQTDRDSLKKEFARIRKAGFAECVEEIEVGVSSVAAPVLISDMGAIFSVGAIGPIRRFNSRYRKNMGKKMIELATEISAALQRGNTIKLG